MATQCKTAMRTIRQSCKQVTILLYSVLLASAIGFWPVNSWAQFGESHWRAETGSWYHPFNWSDGVPTSGKTAVIQNDGTSRIDSPGARALDVNLGYSSWGTLEITNGGTLRNRSSDIRGGSKGIVSGIGSTWTNDGALTLIGDASLTISNGARVTNGHGWIGRHPENNAIVTVDGDGSIWTNTNELRIGYEGTGNLVIANGGLVNALHFTYVGYAGGQGSIQFNDGTLTTESLVAPANRLMGIGTINAMGLITDIDLIFDADHGMSQQIVLANIPDQNITINLDLDGTRELGVGHKGTGSLTIADGVSVVSRRGYLAFEIDSTAIATVSGLGSTWTIGSGLWVGRKGFGNLSVSDGGEVVNSTGILGDMPGSHGVMTIVGAGTKWTNSEEIVIGLGGEGELTIADGGTASNTAGTVGKSIGSNGTIVVTGQYSLWANSGSLNIGVAGTGDLTIADGGEVTSTSASIGNLSQAQGTVTVTGHGSKWNNLGELGVGLDGTGELLISEGGVAFSTVATIGNSTKSYGKVTVSGLNSTWTNTSTLTIGNSGRGDLTIGEGGEVFNTSGAIGSSVGAEGNVLVTGSNSIWTNSSSLSIGNQGNATLTITNGGRVNVGEVTSVGHLTGNGNIIFDNGFLTTKSLLAPASRLGGTGTISTHSLLTDIDLNFNSDHGLRQQLIMASEPDQSITVNLEVDGTGWVGAGYAVTGSLRIADGISVPSSAGYLGYHTGSFGTAEIKGTSSSWEVSGNLSVGRGGIGELTIIDGGTVSNETGRIGELASSAGSAFVTGDNSKWISSSELIVGDRGNGELTISDGGKVSSTTGTLGQNSGSTGTATITGGNSTWINSSSLRVGFSGVGNLTIADGGTVLSTSGLIAGSTGSEGSVTVTGAGAIWTISSFLTVGNAGKGTLLISNGGIVDVGQDTFVNRSTGGGGIINFDNGTLTTRTLLAESNQLVGAGTVNTQGIVSDIGLTFDQSHGLQQQLVLAAQTDQNVTINLDVDGTGTMGAGYRGQGSMTITDGVNLVSATGVLGYHSDSSGTATINGSGSSWISNGGLSVGVSGTGALALADGGMVTSLTGTIGQNPGAEGTVTVTGDNSIWTNNGVLVVGENGRGELAIVEGGAVSSYGARVGSSAFSSFGASPEGNVTVSGENSIWTNNGSLVIAGSQFGSSFDGGTGELRIAEGGEVWNTIGIIGQSSGFEGTVIVTGSNSTWINSGGLIIGNRGTADLIIDDGATVSSTTGAIGQSSGSNGTATVAGGATWTLSGGLTVGGFFSSSSGVLTIGLAGVVQAIGQTSIERRGVLQLQGGTLSTAAINFQGTGGQFNWTAGTLHIGTYNGNLSNPGGTLAPGQSAGSTTVNGTYTQGPAATLEIEIGGLTAGAQHDVVTITDNATLDGELHLAMLGNYVPFTTDTFTILTAGGTLSGTFSNAAPLERLATVDGRGSFLVHYVVGNSFDPNEIVLTDFLLAGDFNDDGTVDAADFTVWRDTDGTPAGYAAWQANFGLTYGMGSSPPESALVPEPDVCGLLLALSLAARFVVRRRGRVACSRPREHAEAESSFP